jgi:hypothetical protein
MQVQSFDRPTLDQPKEVVAWAETFRALSDGDDELQAHGRFFTCAYLLDMGERRVLLRMDAGKIMELWLDPAPLDERYDFSIRASADTWRAFATRTPPPMYHGIWAATFRADMKLEGDLLVLMQNLRCITRQLELLRVAGAPLLPARH